MIVVLSAMWVGLATIFFYVNEGTKGVLCLLLLGVTLLIDLLLEHVR